MELTAREVGTVFRIRYNNFTGSCFLYNYEGKCCFVTAAHNLVGARAGERVLLQKDNSWLSIELTEIAFNEDGYDCCVFSSDDFMMGSLTSTYGDIEVGLGQMVMFLGFPHDLVNTYPGNGYPSPLVRVAHLSGLIEIDGLTIVVLDGFNNPGYSGGPIYAGRGDGELSLFGLVSGYKPERRSHGRIYKKMPDGTEEVDPDHYVKPNSGMIQAIHIGCIRNTIRGLISFNPIRS